jgi:hypothetical protein
MANFTDQFEPSRGDLIYGRTDARQEYFKKVPDGTRTVMSFAWYQVDDFNNYFGVSELESYKGSDASYLASKRTAALDKLKQDKVANQGDLAAAQTLRTKFSDKSSWPNIFKSKVAEPETKDARFSFAEQYSSSIQKSRFNPDNVPTTDQSKIMKNVESLGLTASAEARAYAGLYIALRRGCKFGIGMIASEQVFAKAKVHFILDLIDMTTVCGKRNEPVLKVEIENKIKTEPVTCAELRYVFRNWAKLKGKVLFYVNLEEVNAPWDDDWDKTDILGKPIRAKKSEWEGYHQYREAKYKSGGIPDKSLT